MSKKPATAADARLAREHLNDRIAFDNRHAADHLALARKTADKDSKKYNEAHAEDHQKDAEKARKKLNDGDYLKPMKPAALVRAKKRGPK